jgi:hypothetical protein
MSYSQRLGKSDTEELVRDPEKGNTKGRKTTREKAYWEQKLMGKDSC